MGPVQYLEVLRRIFAMQIATSSVLIVGMCSVKNSVNYRSIGYQQAQNNISTRINFVFCKKFKNTI